MINRRPTNNYLCCTSWMWRRADIYDISSSTAEVERVSSRHPLCVIYGHANSQEASSTIYLALEKIPGIGTLSVSHGRLFRVKSAAVLESISTRPPKSFDSHERGIHRNFPLPISRLCWNSSCKVHQHPNADPRRTSHSYC